MSILVKPVGDALYHGVLMLSHLDFLVPGDILLGPNYV